MVVCVEFVNGDSETVPVRDGNENGFSFLPYSGCFQVACDDGYVWYPESFVKSIRTINVK